MLTYAQGDNAGQLNIVVRYYGSTGDKEFGESIVMQHPAGNYPWQALVGDISMPADINAPNTLPEADEPRAMRFFVRQSAPGKSKGELRMDQFALISWIPTIDLSTPWTTSRYNTVEFLRLAGTSGTYPITLKFERWTPNGCCAMIISPM